MKAFSGAANASLIPTQIAPIRIAPWKAAMISRSFGIEAATRSPAAIPSSRSARAQRSAARSSSA